MNCPLCNTPEIRELFIKDSVAFKHCSNCGFKFSKTEMNPNFQNSLDDYDDAYLQYLEDSIADERNFQSKLDWIEKHSDLVNGKLLDVGCGSGKFVRYLRSHSINACGIEPSKVLFDRYLAGEDCFSNITAEDELMQVCSPWSVITACDVIEHVADPLPFLKSLGAILADHGCVFIETVDAGSWIARLLGRRWHFYHKYHLSYFSKATLCRLCELSGFELESWERHTVYFPLGYIFRYARELIVPGNRQITRNIFDEIHIPLNTCDRFRACLRKKIQ